MGSNLFRRSRQLDRYEGRVNNVLFYCKEKPDAETEGRAVRIGERFPFRRIKLADAIQSDRKWSKERMPRAAFIEALGNAEIDLDYNALTFPNVIVDGEPICVRTKFSGEMDRFEGIVAVYKKPEW